MAETSSIQSGQKEIPGFYYDEVKKRYFKLAHTASGGHYTSSSISKRRKMETQAKEEERDARIKAKHQSSAIKRLQLPEIEALSLERSLGKTAKSTHERIWTKSLHDDPAGARLLDVAGQRAKICYDASTQTMYFASSRFVSYLDMARNTHRPVQSYAQQIYPLIPVAPLRSSISSLCFESTARVMIGTSLGEGSRPAEIILKTDHGSRIATVDGTLWCSAVSAGQPRFAAAGSTVILYDYLAGEASRSTVKVKGHTDVMSMDFLDTHILALGCRNGTLQLYDVRTASEKHRTSSRFLHGRPNGLGIAKVKAHNQHQLVVSGLDSTLCLYDFRFLKEQKPLVTYRGHRNEYALDLNSVVISHNTVMAAQESRGLGIWHLDGEFLHTKETAGQIDDIILEGQHNDAGLAYTVSQGLLSEWRVGGSRPD